MTYLLAATLLAILAALVHLDRRITTGAKTTMSALDDLATALDAETNAVAAKLDHLAADLAAALAKGEPPSAEQLAKLSAISDRLKSLGSDPAAPIPPAAP